MVHAKFAGEETIVMVPFFAEQENPKLNVVAGDIGYYPGRQTICLFYGETKPFGEVSYFARVRSNLDGLARVGRRILEVGHVRRPAGGLLMARQTATELVEELRQFTAQTLGRRAARRPAPARTSRCRRWGTSRASSTATSTCSGRASSCRSAARRRSPATCDCPS